MLSILRQSDERSVGLLFAFGALLCAGTYSALAKGLTPYLSPVSLLVISEALTALFVVLTYGAVPMLRSIAKLDMRTVGVCMLTGLLNSALAPLLWFWGLRMTTAVNAAILTPTELICSLLVGKWLLGERINRAQAMGAATIVFGIVAIHISSTRGFSVNPGDALIVIAAQVFAFGALLFKKYLTHIQPEVAIAIRNVSGIIFVLAGYSIVGAGSAIDGIEAFPPRLLFTLLAFVFFSRYLNLAFYYKALDRLPATTVSLIDIGAPLAGMAFSALLLGETIQTPQLFGGMFIVLGLLLEQQSRPLLSHVSVPGWARHFWHARHEPPLQQMALKVGKQA